jgi:hypothetical protein
MVRFLASSSGCWGAGAGSILVLCQYFLPFPSDLIVCLVLPLVSLELYRFKWYLALGGWRVSVEAGVARTYTISILPANGWNGKQAVLAPSRRL